MRWMNRSWKKLLLAGLSALSLFPAPALAQDASGKFVLPREVHWGGVSLPPGEYSYSIEHRAGETVLLRSADGKHSLIVMPSTTSLVDPPATSQLLLRSEGGEWFVASMVLSIDGEELHFATPTKRITVAQDANLHHAKLAALSHP
jgi:hypothetical protein